MKSKPLGKTSYRSLLRGFVISHKEALCVELRKKILTLPLVNLVKK